MTSQLLSALSWEAGSPGAGLPPPGSSGPSDLGGPTHAAPPAVVLTGEPSNVPSCGVVMGTEGSTVSHCQFVSTHKNPPSGGEILPMRTEAGVPAPDSMLLPASPRHGIKASLFIDKENTF